MYDHGNPTDPGPKDGQNVQDAQANQAGGQGRDACHDELCLIILSSGDLQPLLGKQAGLGKET